MLDIGVKVRSYMKKNVIEYSDDEIGRTQKVIDFLPLPKDLVLKKRSVKITLNLSENSINFFKKESKKLGVPYQRIIKSLLDKYTEAAREKRID